jgi:putative protein kinase ArgK-like GTPase of G3E family
VLQTVADADKGVEELAAALDGHFEWLTSSGERERRRAERWTERVREVADRSIGRTVWTTRGGQRMLADAAADATRRSPYEVAATIVAATIGDGAAVARE